MDPPVSSTSRVLGSPLSPARLTPAPYKMKTIASIALTAGALAGLFLLRAQAQAETAGGLLDGERAFRNPCANCHGPDGDLITGIDLGRGRFRRPMTDEDLVRTI